MKDFFYLNDHIDNLFKEKLNKIKSIELKNKTSNKMLKQIKKNSKKIDKFLKNILKTRIF